MRKMKPLYMWAGGKNKMIPKYKELPGIPYSGYDTFVEPFFGGGAMMIHIYENNPNVKRFVLNDINAEIVGLYRAIKDNLSEFITECDAYCNHYLTLDKVARKAYYYDTRKQYTTQYQNWSPTKESATLYFLMKTAFNGIWQTTKEAKGRFCTPCGLLNQKDEVYNKNNVLEWNKFLQKVSIYNGNWRDCCDDVQGKALYFFDPPYRDSFTQYGTEFDDSKHKELIDYCKDVDQLGHIAMYCNREANDDFYTKNQGQLKISYYDIKYTAGRRATEVLTKEDGDEETIKTAKAAREVLMYSEAIEAVCLAQPKEAVVSAKKPKVVKQLPPLLFEYTNNA